MEDLKEALRRKHKPWIYHDPDFINDLFAFRIEGNETGTSRSVAKSIHRKACREQCIYRTIRDLPYTQQNWTPIKWPI